MFSLAGIPPMFGFWPKLMVFNAAVQEGSTALAVAGILGTVVGAYYYLRIVKVMYFDAPGAALSRKGKPGKVMIFLLRAGRLATRLFADRSAGRSDGPRRGKFGCTESVDRPVALLRTSWRSRATG